MNEHLHSHLDPRIPSYSACISPPLGLLSPSLIPSSPTHSPRKESLYSPQNENINFFNHPTTSNNLFCSNSNDINWNNQLFLSKDGLKNYMNSPNTNILNTNFLLNSQPVISRIILFGCNKMETLQGIIKTFSNLPDIAAYKVLEISNVPTMVVGWFDSRKISIQVQQLRLLYLGMTKYPLDYRTIDDDDTLKVIIAETEFKFLEDNYASIYVCQNTFNHFDVKFEQECFLYLSKFGSVEVFNQLGNLPNVYKCSYFDIRDAFEAKKLSLNNLKNSKFSIFSTMIELYEEMNIIKDVKRRGSLKRNQKSGNIINNWLSKSNSLQTNLDSMKTTQDEWRKYQQLKYRRLAALPFVAPHIPEENKINTDDIKSGKDKRKTLMIRNIPNKIKHEELEEFVNATSKGKYDFLYLRIDFENHCNVGYAFISFTDPKSIIKFYNERAGKKWNKFNSEKVCELAYAKIQGKDKLTQKFRYSKVMEQSPEYHPRIYYSNGPWKGLPEKFPVPEKD